MEIDDSLIPEQFIVTNADGTKTVDFSTVKTQKDIDNVKSALEKRIVDRESELNNLKQQINQSKSTGKSADFLALQNQFNELKAQFDAAENEKKNLELKVKEGEFKDYILKDKDLNIAAANEFFNRVNREGFTKTEVNGKIDWINSNGKSASQFINELKANEKFWFNSTTKSSSAINYQDAEKNNDIKAMIAAKRAARN